ncbi:C-C motif chemokine 19-like isoform X2 [Periophthalmus magnuspinnatus]|uniref:C-C motif chemokine 19-like isoform X2 n=1 Tax=Periophthalmus magnuspinnatus TaxID=409849 RepID=UPI00145A4CBE|nr:C-C motif chemokine 19-like isoform X2 [Periophthalmus magnuspinnatus]
MRTITVATVLLCLGLVNSAREKAVSSHGAQTCCTSYTRSPIPFHRITGVKTQTVMENCDLDAIIFETVKKNKICADRRAPWVQRILKMLSDQFKKLAKERPDVRRQMQMDKSVKSVMDNNSGVFFSSTESSQNITESFYTSGSTEAFV